VTTSSGLSLERRPSGIDVRLTVARAEVQVGTASRAESLAILATQGKPRRREQPLFPQGWTEIDRRGPRFQHVHIRVVRLFIGRIGKQQVKLLVDLDSCRPEATPALLVHFPGHPPAEVKLVFAGRGEPARDDHTIDWPRIICEPNGIVGRQLSINPSGLRLEGRSVEGQHGSPTI
jgi:hypothetical protein